MSNSPEDIIELTDIIEHGPGTAEKSGADGGVDLSFERELEDLFAESPHEKPAQGDQKAPAHDLSDLPGLDDLHLPEEASKGGDDHDIDMDGLDALLAEAEKSASDVSGGSRNQGMGDLPELADDFLSDAAFQSSASDADLSAPDLSMFDAPAPAPAVAGATAAPIQGDFVSVQALESLSARLEALEEKLLNMGDSLAGSFKTMLDDALTAFKAELPAPAEPVQEAPDAVGAAETAAMIAELKETLERQNEALREELSSLATPAQEPLDESALAERVKQEVLAALPQPSEPAAPVEAVDAQAMAQEIESRLDERLAALQAQVEAVSVPAQEPLDESALAERVKLDVLAAMPEPQPAESGERLSELQDVCARLDAEFADVKARIEAVPAPIDVAPLERQLAGIAASQEELKTRLDALSVQPAAPDLSGMATSQDLASLRQELEEEMKKAVPAAAARIIREEIQALVREMD